MKENNDGQDVGRRPGFRQLRTLICAAILVGVPVAVASADLPSAMLHSDSDLPVVSQQTEIRAVVRPTDSGVPALASELEDSVVPAQYEESQQYIISAAFPPKDLVSGQNMRVSGEGRERTDSAGNLTDIGESDEQPTLPYALVLALLAIIGLVPVSRRSH